VAQPNDTLKKKFRPIALAATKQQKGTTDLQDYQNKQFGIGHCPRDKYYFAGCCSAESSKKHKVRSFRGGWQNSVKPLSHRNKGKQKTYRGRIGVAMAWTIKKWATGDPFISTGSTAPKAWAARKLQKVFEGQFKKSSYFRWPQNGFAETNKKLTYGLCQDKFRS